MQFLRVSWYLPPVARRADECLDMLLNTVLFAFLATAVYAAAPRDLSVVKNGIMQMCEQNNITSDTLQQAQVYAEKFVECAPIMEQYGQLPVELGSASQNGTAVDDAARRFCANAEKAKSCRANHHNAVGLCMKLDMQNFVPYSIKIANSTVDYLCNEEDHKIILAKMVDEGVMQCIDNGTRGLFQCFNSPPGPSANLKAGFETTARCAVDKLKACSLVAGARAEDMFNYIYNKLSPLVDTAVPTPSGGLTLFAFYF